MWGAARRVSSFLWPLGAGAGLRPWHWAPMSWLSPGCGEMLSRCKAPCCGHQPLVDGEASPPDHACTSGGVAAPGSCEPGATWSSKQQVWLLPGPVLPVPEVPCGLYVCGCVAHPAPPRNRHPNVTTSPRPPNPSVRLLSCVCTEGPVQFRNKHGSFRRPAAPLRVISASGLNLSRTGSALPRDSAQLPGGSAGRGEGPGAGTRRVFVGAPAGLRTRLQPPGLPTGERVRSPVHLAVENG